MKDTRIKSVDSSERIFFFGIACAFLYYAVLCWIYNPYRIGDDAYFTFQYARNMAHGNGLVFNSGECVWGFTSPFFVLMLVIPALFHLDLPHISVVLGCIFLGGTAYVWTRLTKTYLTTSARILLFTYLCTLPSGFWFLGFENKLLIFLESLFLLLIVEGQGRKAAFCGACACLTRPDALLLVLPALAYNKETRRPHTIIAFAFPGITWLSFTWFYYGAFLPHSFYAKQGHTSFWNYITEASVFVNPLQLSSTSNPCIYGFLSLTCLYLQSKLLRLNGYLVFALVVYPWLLLVAYAVIGTPAHYWEIYSGLFFMTTALAISSLAYIDRAKLEDGKFYFSILFSSILVFNISRDYRALGSSNTSIKNLSYQMAAQWIRSHTFDTTYIGASEAGTIAYYLENYRILDLAKIISLDTNCSQRTCPEYLLLSETGAHDFELNRTIYQVVSEFPKLPQDDIMLFKRKE